MTEEMPARSDDAEPAAELDPELAAQLVAKVPACRHCGGRHVRSCPRVKRMAFHPSGQLAEVEFWPEIDWSTDHVIFDDDPPSTPTEGRASLT